MDDIAVEVKFKIDSIPSAYLTDLQNRLISGSVLDYHGETFNGLRVKYAFEDQAGTTAFDGYNFSGCVFDNVSFGYTPPGGITLSSGSFIGAAFNGCLFRNVDFDGSNFDTARFTRCSGSGLDFQNCSIDGTVFDNNAFYGLNFTDCDVSEADWKTNNNLRNVWFENSNCPAALAYLFKDANEE